MPRAIDIEGMTPSGQHESRTCVVVRMFNESAVVGGVLRDLLSRFPTVIAVDDGSDDQSAQIAQQAGALVVRHPVNLGAGAALQTGIEAALTLPGIEYIACFDADGQHRVQDAVAMVEIAYTSRADVVLGSRFLERDSYIPVSRRLLLRFAAVFTRLTTGLAVTDAHCGLRVFTREAAQHITLRFCGMAYASELLQVLRAQRLEVRECPVQVRYTNYSRSKGQRNLNAVNIAFDLLLRTLRAPA